MRLSLIISLFVCVNTFAQEDNGSWNLNNYLWNYSKYDLGKPDKRLLDFKAIQNWRGLGSDISVSNDGKFFAYTIVKRHDRNDTYEEYDSLVVESTDNALRWSFSKAKPGQFTADNEQYIFSVNDTLFFLGLRSKEIKLITKVETYNVFTNGGNNWIVYQLKDTECNLVLKDLVSGNEKCFSGASRYQIEKNGQWLACLLGSNALDENVKNLLIYQLGSGRAKWYSSVEEYFYSSNGNVFVVKLLDSVNGTVLRKLQYIKLAEGKPKTIWSAKLNAINVASCSLDEDGKQVVFNTTGGKIYYYHEGMDTATIEVSNQSQSIPKEFQINESVSFTDNGKYILFSLQKIPSPAKPKVDAVQLEVRSFKDADLTFSKTYPTETLASIKAVVNIINNRVTPLETEDKTLYKLYGDFAIIQKPGNATHGDRFWEEGYYDDSTWLVSLSGGSQILLPAKCESKNKNLWFSPTGKFILYFDATRGSKYFSYDLHNKKEHAISSNVPFGELGRVASYEYNANPKLPNGISAWLGNDEGVLVYGKYDIWLLDLTGKKQAINITNGYGKSHNIVFSLSNYERLSSYPDKVPLIEKKGTLQLWSFCPSNKYTGFYVKTIDKPGDPELLYSGPYFFNQIKACYNPNLSNEGHIPIQAKDAKVWIVQRQSALDAPNYYKTKDFKSFTRLTNFQPQAGYEWLTQELHSYQHLDGKKGQGILYKPENFDASKKYPVLIIFYQDYSDNLYQFRVPALNQSVITPGESPIWFLNNGYLVFVPDIYVDSLKYGPTAFNVIEGAARYLKQLPFVDANKLGCGSHSWSAKLGSYIFTHSSSFAATAISEGFLFVNPLGMAFSQRDGASRLGQVEQDFEYGSFWQNKESWLDQTAVLNADKAKSPLLLFCNKRSSEDYQDQTLQLFTALRRLEKKVWWLRYENGSHMLDDPDEMKDFTIRYTQYFDHYLKNAPAPMWMTQGMPLSMKGIESRYELDPAGTCSLSGKSDCPICKAWNEQYKRTPEMFAKPIAEWELDKDIAETLRQAQDDKRKQLDKEGEVQTREVLRMLNSKK